jgi:hypothetical protein
MIFPCQTIGNMNCSFQLDLILYYLNWQVKNRIVFWTQILHKIDIELDELISFFEYLQLKL